MNLLVWKSQQKILSTLGPAEQIGVLNYFENERYAGIVIFPLNDRQVIQKINQLSSNGTAIITFNSQIEEINENQDRKEDAFKIMLKYMNTYNKLSGIYITGGGVAGIGKALSITEKTGLSRLSAMT